jgi:hypothetical protein
VQTDIWELFDSGIRVYGFLADVEQAICVGSGDKVDGWSANGTVDGGDNSVCVYAD